MARQAFIQSVHIWLNMFAPSIVCIYKCPSVQSQGLIVSPPPMSTSMPTPSLHRDRPTLPYSQIFDLFNFDYIFNGLYTHRVSKRSDDPPINYQTSGQMICQSLSCVYLPVVSTYLWAPNFYISPSEIGCVFRSKCQGRYVFEYLEWNSAEEKNYMVSLLEYLIQVFSPFCP